MVIAGEEYVTAINASESDRRVRAAFHERAAMLTPAGALLFDFGCGPGIDALHYAQRGHRVAAYDVDARMCDAFRKRCADQIAAGTVRLQSGTFREFLDSNLAHGSIDLVTANFAPLNLIDDAAELFRKFHALTSPNAAVLASVLNPTYVGDMRSPWWWRGRLAYWRTGVLDVDGADWVVHRRSPANFAAAARPFFRLESVLPGSRASHPFARLAANFLFLVFRRN